MSSDEGALAASQRVLLTHAGLPLHCCGGTGTEPRSWQPYIRSAWTYFGFLLDTMVGLCPDTFLTLSHESKWGDWLDNRYKHERGGRMMKLLDLLMILVDSVLRGVGQAILANNPISGLFILIGVGIANRWQLAMGVLGALLSTYVVTHLFGSVYLDLMRAGR